MKIGNLSVEVHQERALRIGETKMKLRVPLFVCGLRIHTWC